MSLTKSAQACCIGLSYKTAFSCQYFYQLVGCHYFNDKFNPVAKTNVGYYNLLDPILTGNNSMHHFLYSCSPGIDNFSITLDRN